MFDKIQLSPLQLEKIEEATLAVYPKEMCGILTACDFFPLQNVHETPEAAFRFDRMEFAKFLPITTAIVHSHTRSIKTPEFFDLRTPSFTDMQQQKRSNLPWLIVGTEGLTVTEPLQFPRTPNNNYLGRKFLWFINDCYTLVQDWYRFELGIELPDADIKNDYREIRHLNDLFEPFIADYKFVEVPFRHLADHDLVLLDNAGFNRNHLGVYCKGKVWHQDMLSVCEPVETFLGRINKVLRYEG